MDFPLNIFIHSFIQCGRLHIHWSWWSPVHAVNTRWAGKGCSTGTWELIRTRDADADRWPIFRSDWLISDTQISPVICWRWRTQVMPREAMSGCSVCSCWSKVAELQRCNNSRSHRAGLQGSDKALITAVNQSRNIKSRHSLHRWWMWMDDTCQFSADSQPKSTGLVWGLAATRRSVYIHQMNRVNSRNDFGSWWQHHKHCHGYYYYYYYPIRKNGST